MRSSCVCAYSQTHAWKNSSRGTSRRTEIHDGNFTGVHVRNVGSPVNDANIAHTDSSSWNEFTARSYSGSVVNKQNGMFIKYSDVSISSSSHRLRVRSPSSAGTCNIEKSSAPFGCNDAPDWPTSMTRL